MSECDHAIALDGHEFSLWDQRVECPYCRMTELEAKEKLLDDALWWLAGKAARLEFGEHEHIDRLQRAVWAEAISAVTEEQDNE